jgi:hypothetical protein
MTPQRIQRKRTKGWRMPENTVYVGRGSRWGNHCVVVPLGKHGPYDVVIKNQSGQTIGFVGQSTGIEGAKDVAVDTYVRWINSQTAMWLAGYLLPLRGKNLACWCPPDHPCHADVLLEVANGEVR